MKFSTETLSILKNFKLINSSIILKGGRVIKTISNQSNILAEAEVDETFELESPVSFYDLGRFLSCIELVEDADLEFGSQSVAISNRYTSVEFRYSDPALKIKEVPTKPANIGEEVVNFELPNDVLAKLTKASAIMNLPDLSLVGEGGQMELRLTDRRAETTCNKYAVSVGETDKEFCFHFQMKNLLLLSGDYSVIVGDLARSRFEHHSVPVLYWIALEPGQ